MRSLFKKSLLILTALFSLQALAQMVVMNDTAIVASIQNQLANNPLTTTAQITLTSQQGNVTLIGTVETDEQAGAVVEIAQATPGVIDVGTSNLRVRDSKKSFTDTVITAKVKGLFIRNQLFLTQEKDNVAVLSVKVETKNGVVHLSGTAHSEVEVGNAIQVIRSVKGVKKIKSSIRIFN